MSKKRSYRCSKCGHVYYVFTGPASGDHYLAQYYGVMQEILAGEYGAEWKTEFEKTPFAAFNAAEYLYVCDDCNEWSVAANITLYAPNDIEKVKRKKYGNDTFADLGYTPFVTEEEMEKDFHVVKQYTRLCSCCGKPMRKVPDRERVKLRCSMCGAVNAETD